MQNSYPNVHCLNPAYDSFSFHLLHLYALALAHQTLNIKVQGSIAANDSLLLLL